MVYSNEDLQLLQLCEELILKEIDKICIKHNICYFVGGGTALGLRRHGGFIPWDDDIDINMPRDDYNRFLKIGISELPDFLFLQNHNTDANFPRLYSKVRLKGTKFVEYQYRNLKMEQGIFIDIFPMDQALDNVKFLRKMDKRISKCYRLYDLRVNPSSNQPILSLSNRLKNGIKHVIHYMLCVFPKSFYSDSYYKLLKKNKVESDYLADFGTNNGESFIISNEIVLPTERSKFHLIEVNQPHNIDRFLSVRYGEDYLSLPPIEKRVNHSPYILEFGQYSVDVVLRMISSDIM